jgi:hypothetical protein
MRTCVRMPRDPFIPGKEFDHAVERGDLEIATALAKDIATDVGKPIPLEPEAVETIQRAL